MQRAKPMRSIIFSSVAFLSLPYLLHYSKFGEVFRKI